MWSLGPGIGVGVAVGTEVGVRTGVGLLVGVGVGVSVGVGTSVGSGTGVGVAVGIGVAVGRGVGVGRTGRVGVGVDTTITDPPVRSGVRSVVPGSLGVPTGIGVSVGLTPVVAKVDSGWVDRGTRVVVPLGCGVDVVPAPVHASVPKRMSAARAATGVMLCVKPYPPEGISIRHRAAGMKGHLRRGFHQLQRLDNPCVTGQATGPMPTLSPFGVMDEEILNL